MRSQHVGAAALRPCAARIADTRCCVPQELATADALPAAAEADAVVAAEASAPLASAAPASAGAAEFTPLHDDTLAYSFEYPVTTGEGRQLSWVFTREPTRCAFGAAAPRRARRADALSRRYSAAAPLSADARQRIVCEVRPDAPALLRQSLTRRCRSWPTLRARSRSPSLWARLRRFWVRPRLASVAPAQQAA